MALRFEALHSGQELYNHAEPDKLGTRSRKLINLLFIEVPMLSLF